MMLRTILWDEAQAMPEPSGVPAPYETEAEAQHAIETDPASFPAGYRYAVERYSISIGRGRQKRCAYRVLVYDDAGRFVGYASNRRA